MSSLALHLGFLLLYLLGLLAVGFLTNLRMKRSAEGFFLGSRSVGPWVTAFSFVSAYFSSVVIIGGGAFGYRFGMGTLWVGATNVVVGTLLAWLLLGARTRRMTGRLRSITMPGFFARRYRSSPARVISAAVITIFLVLYSVSILKGMGDIFDVLVGRALLERLPGLARLLSPYELGVFLSAVIILVYVAFGGYLAVVWTGFFQGWVMIFGLLLLTFLAVGRVGSLQQVFSSLGAIENGRYLGTPGAWSWVGLVSFSMIVSFGVWGMPQLVTRFYSIRSSRVLKLGTVLATLGGAMALLPYFNGALTRILRPDIQELFSRTGDGRVFDLAIPSLVETVLPPWASSVFLAAVIAAGMSSFSAVLIVAVSSIVKDLYRDTFHARPSPRAQVLMSRLASVVIGLLALVIALKPPGMVLVITGFAWAVIASTTLWPYVLGLYWRRATRAGAVVSMIGGCATALTWEAVGRPLALHGFIPGVTLSLLLFLLASLVTHRPGPETLRIAFGDGRAGSERQPPTRS